MDPLLPASDLRCRHDLPCHAMNRKVTCELEVLLAKLFDSLGAKCDLGEFRHIQKVRAAEVLIPLGLARIDSGGVNG